MYSPEKKWLNDENTYKKQLYLDQNIQKWKEIKYYDVEKISNIYNVTSWHEIIWMPVHVPDACALSFFHSDHRNIYY